MKGFTLVEFLVVLGVWIVLGTVAFSGYDTLDNEITLDRWEHAVIRTLNVARDRTVHSKNASQHGVHFDANGFTLFQGGAYSASDPKNEVHSLPTELEIHSVSLSGGGNEVVFDRVLGTTPHSGSVQIHQKSQTNRNKKILIYSQGQVGEEGIVTTTNTRVTDSRHVHFDLGWSIQGASAFTLVFQDGAAPDVTYTMGMSPYFSLVQTVFDWEGTVNVNGSSQVLRLHTHDLGPANTMLSIHRDGRENSKGVDVSIDGHDIVSWSDAGVPGVGFFGGSMTIQ